MVNKQGIFHISHTLVKIIPTNTLSHSFKIFHNHLDSIKLIVCQLIFGDQHGILMIFHRSGDHRVPIISDTDQVGHNRLNSVATQALSHRDLQMIRQIINQQENQRFL